MEHNLTQGEGAGVCAQRGGSPLHSVRINEMRLHKEAFPNTPLPPSTTRKSSKWKKHLPAASSWLTLQPKL